MQTSGTMDDFRKLDMDEHGELDNGSIQGSGTTSEVQQWMNSWKLDNGTF
jgi:hypothetical protein